MEVEGRSGKKPSGPKPIRNKTMNKFQERKATKKNRLRKSLKQRKAMQEQLMEEAPGKDWKVILREKFEQVIQTSGPSLAFGLSRLFKEENVRDILWI